MEKMQRAAEARRHLDERFRSFPPATAFAVPVRGWIRAIREALGMSSSQLAQRLGIAQSSVVSLEQSELKGSIELASLRKVAEALDCNLVYALVPKKPLHKLLLDRALLWNRARRASVEHSMLLEDQAVPAPAQEPTLEQLLRESNPARLWDQP